MVAFPVAVRSGVSLALIAICSLAAALPRAASAQHITVDGRFSPAQTLVGPNYSIGANLGKQVGSNLFHSFGQFGLATGESAAFSGPATISNVIGRVTGGNASSIDGKIQSNIAGANLYLINPSGIVFGPNATVNVSGSFHASTADYLKMSDGAKFQATNPDGSTLSAAPPAAFGFLTARPAALSVNGSTLGPVPGTLGLVAGPVSVNNGAALSAPAGTIHVTSAASTGEVAVDPRNTAASTVSSFGPVAIKGGSTLDVSNPSGLGSGGSVFIRSGALTIDASEINADNYGSAAGGQIMLRGENQVSLANTAYVHALTLSSTGAGVVISTAPAGAISADASTVLTESVGPGDAGLLSVSGGQLMLTNGAILGSVAAGNGRSGDISIGLTNGLVIDGSAGPALQVGILAAGIATATEPGATGQAGHIKITANSLSIVSGGQISASTFGSGSAGSVELKVTGDLQVSNGTASQVTGILASTFLGKGNAGQVSADIGSQLWLDGGGTGIAAIAADSVKATGTAGSVSVKAGSLSIVSGGEISSNAGLGNANAGTVDVHVDGPLSINGGMKGIAVIAADSLGGTGNAGDVTVTAGALSIVNGGEIASDAGFGVGRAGKISVNISGQLTVDGGAKGISLISASSVSNAGNSGDVTVKAAEADIRSGGQITTVSLGAMGNAGNVSVDVTGRLSIDRGSISSSSNPLPGITSTGNAGNVAISAARLEIINGGVISTNTFTSGNAGTVSVTAGTLSIASNGAIVSNTFGSGKGGNVSVTVGGQLTIDGMAADPNLLTGIGASSEAGSTGNAGDVTVKAGVLSIVNGGEILSDALGRSADLPASTGSGGSISVSITGALLIDGTGTLIATDTFGKGSGGDVSVTAGALSILNGGEISSDTAQGSGGNAGNATVTAGTLTIVGGTISSGALGAFDGAPASTGNAGYVSVSAGTLSIANHGAIVTNTFGPGIAGSVSVTVNGQLTITGIPGGGLTGIASNAGAGKTGDAGKVTVSAGTLTLLHNGEIASGTFGAGKGGSVSVNVAGQSTIDATSADTNFVTGIDAQANAGGTGDAGNVQVSAGSLIILNGGKISSRSLQAANGGPASTGNAGSVTVDIAGLLSIDGSGSTIATSTGEGTRGNAGSVVVTAGQITLLSGGEIASTTAGVGAGGSVFVTTPGALLLDGAGGAETQIAASATGLQSGPAGSVSVTAGGLTVAGGAQIASTTSGPGKGGTVQVIARGPLSLSDPGSGIIALANSSASGDAGSIKVGAPQIAVSSGAEIASTTAGTAAGGSVDVTTPGALVLDGAGIANTQIAASALGQRSGPGGSVMVQAGTLMVRGGAQIASTTSGPGKGGTVQVIAQGPLSLSDPGSGIVALAMPAASGDAGSVMVTAPQITLTAGGVIASTTTGTGAGGSVNVATPGRLVLSGMGDPNTEIAASAKGLNSGPGGNVMVAAGSLSIEGGARIASSTAGPGKGGDVNITVGSDIVLPDPGPQITAQSTGSGDAGSITVSAARMLMNNGAEISTEAMGERSKASGGNIALHVRDFLYLTSSEISTSVKGETGNGGNITIDPQLVILNHSSIIAQAIEGHGGNITITADQFIPSSDSIVSASSELGISGTIVINGPRVDVNGALVVLSTQLRSRTEVLRQACAARAGQPVSSLVEAGRGGLLQDPEATLPALYIAGRDLNPNPPPGTDTVELSATPIHATARLTMRCG
jgi:filamentous hemagglutinin family protein